MCIVCHPSVRPQSQWEFIKLCHPEYVMYHSHQVAWLLYSTTYRYLCTINKRQRKELVILYPMGGGRYQDRCGEFHQKIYFGFKWCSGRRKHVFLLPGIHTHVYFAEGIGGQWKYLKFKGGQSKNCLFSELGQQKYLGFSHINLASPADKWWPVPKCSYVSNTTHHLFNLRLHIIKFALSY